MGCMSCGIGVCEMLASPITTWACGAYRSRVVRMLRITDGILRIGAISWAGVRLGVP